MSKADTHERSTLIANDLAAFADIGTEAPSIEPHPTGSVVRFVRHGDLTEIQISNNNEALIETWADETVKHANIRALLASGRYGNLRDWASKQSAFLDQEDADSRSLIAVLGFLNDDFTSANENDIDELLCKKHKIDSTRLLLIDGPAGIGKTQFILSLSKSRSKNYINNRRPLILHIQSRGRTLSYLYDMMAFSLQRMRVYVTFDQAPILAKHGLITLAIDGFDELADPDGYGNAWAQVSDLIEALRGSGSIILAGRETFIGRDRVLKDISSLRDDKDEINVLTLQPPSKSVAIRWLSEQGWSDTQISSIEDYLEPNSLALRPFFLRTLANPEIAESLSNSAAISVLSILMEAMIEREVGKFGDAIERVLTASERRHYIISLLGEAARDMAESNNSSISDATLSWLVDVALPKDIDESLVRILKARSHALAFFTNDDRRGYRKFYHDKFYEYFLSISAIDMITSGQTGRMLSRNILASSFLETFGDVISSGVQEERISKFCNQVVDMFSNYPPVDRTKKNLGALILASLAVAEFHDNFGISSIDLDECRIAGTASGGVIRDSFISQLDCRGANLAAVSFDNSNILSLIADRDTVLPELFPNPQIIRDVSKGTETLFTPEAREAWVRSHLESPPIEEVALLPHALRQHPAVKLLQRACRMRQYWLRRGDDIYAARILDDPWWPTIEEILSESELIKIEVRQASGTDARFLHIRQAEEILSENKNDPTVVYFYQNLCARLLSLV
ncbi:hypothetical protein HLH36_15675 [Gluconacetobacter aggeris]|uniref:NACHT domain-containing protein n=1 Tax=Gluconacetobacter aggeris TaxID=1286186 RepID=A0A7W4NXI2_9PROT|nr:hypothetical protein [Gluconacetobacter aggeris]MBB2169767.1 hypothetical protein [Gluconacetobacter aggeris]